MNNSIKFNWCPQVMDDPIFMPECVVTSEAETTEITFKSKFADLPSSGIWADRTDDELLGLI